MVSLRAGEDGSHCLGHLAHRHQCHSPCTTLRCWRPLAPTRPGSRPGHSDACRCRQGVLHLSSHQRHSTNRRNAGGTQSRRPISPSFGGPVLGVEWPSCLVPKDTCFPGHAQKRWRGKRRGEHLCNRHGPISQLSPSTLTNRSHVATCYRSKHAQRASSAPAWLSRKRVPQSATDRTAFLPVLRRNFQNAEDIKKPPISLSG